MATQEDLLPSAIICSCGKRFESLWSADNTAKPKVVPSIGSALWLFLRHCSTRTSIRSTRHKPHRADLVLISCLLCRVSLNARPFTIAPHLNTYEQNSVDINSYRQHLFDCRADDEIDATVAHYRQLLDNCTAPRRRLPTFECFACLDRDEFRQLDLAALVEHSHDASSYKSGSDSISFECYIECRVCDSKIPLANAALHATLLHADRLQSASGIADIFTTTTVQPDPESTELWPRFECESCGSEFFTDELLQQHSSVHAPPQAHWCMPCRLGYATRKQLLHHRRDRHTEKGRLRRLQLQERHFQCEHCPKAFNLDAQLVIHMRTHTGERPFKCPECSKAFATKMSLLSHRARVHGKGSTFRCCHCDKRFALTSQLTVHMRMHTGEKPHRCDECGKSFRLLETMQRHTLIHTDELRFACKPCEKAFKTSKSLEQHCKMQCHAVKVAEVKESGAAATAGLDKS